MGLPATVLVPALSLFKERPTLIYFMLFFPVNHNVWTSIKLFSTLVAPKGFFHRFMAIQAPPSIATIVHIPTGLEGWVVLSSVTLQTFFCFKYIFTEIAFLFLVGYI